MIPRFIISVCLVALSLLFQACTQRTKVEVSPKLAEERKYKLERVGPAAIVQVYADGFEQLTPKERIFSYYLYLAG